MAGQVYDIEVNSETPREDLERCIGTAEHTSNVGVQRVAAQAKAEIARRELSLVSERLNAEEKARVRERKFQEAENKKMIEAQESLMGQQLEVAQEQTEAAKGSARAAKWSAIATIVIAGLTVIIAGIALIQYLRG
ncbi:MAG: hypothetical protein O7F75_13135 [Alphaproteobacteria bacterium]|nr:hypothetical protein [Alphaproteobacteria bacterium]